MTILEMLITIAVDLCREVLLGMLGRPVEEFFTQFLKRKFTRRPRTKSGRGSNSSTEKRNEGEKSSDEDQP